LGRAAFALVALLLAVSLAAPEALANPVDTSLSQSEGSTNPSVVPCMGLNESEDSFIPTIVSGLHVALIQQVLTSTPYSQYNTGSFYAFYAKEKGVTTNVTTNLNLLSTNVSSSYGYNEGWGASYQTYLFFNSILAKSCGFELGKNVHVLTDMDVANGALFYPQNHTSRFDVIVLPFSEYVEAPEYLAYENFVAGGGTLVMMAHSLEYEVRYNATTNVETLVYGHGWAFDGRYAHPVTCGATSDASCPWAKNSTNWIGSNSCLVCSRAQKYNGSVVNIHDPTGRSVFMEFGAKVFKSYAIHEEDVVTNMTGTSIVSSFVNDSRNLIASYTHHFRKGAVVSFGFIGDDIIQKDQSAQYFLLLGAVLGRSVPTSAVSSSTTALTNSTTTATSSTAVSSSTTGLASSATTLPSRTTASSNTGRTTTAAVTTSGSPGAPPSVLVALGGVAAVVAGGAAVLSRRRPSAVE